MDFEWDPSKAAVNRKKHGVDFADAALVLYDDCALTMPDAREYGEERFVTMGMDPVARLLVVVYATRAERRRYESKR